MFDSIKLLLRAKSASGRLSRRLALRFSTAAALVVSMALPGLSMAQSIKEVQEPKNSLELKSRGSFFVGGESVEKTLTQIGYAIAGHMTNNQMYVEYMSPAKEKGLPIVLMHGMSLTGKTWDTTPDGRMGWYEYFVRRGHSVYVPDQAGRGRSGFDPAKYNDVQGRVQPPESQPVMRVIGDEAGFTVFRIGTPDGKPFPDTQFPTDALDQLSAQTVPDLNSTLPSPNPTYAAMAKLAQNVKGAVLFGHSQAGGFPIQAALTNAKGVKGIVMVEPGGCGSSYSAEQLAVLTKIPTLVVFGDHLDAVTQVGTFSWRNSFEACKNFVKLIKSNGGKSKMMYLPDEGLHGNTHMMMQDKNSKVVADLILKWLDKNVEQ